MHGESKSKLFAAFLTLVVLIAAVMPAAVSMAEEPTWPEGSSLTTEYVGETRVMVLWPSAMYAATYNIYVNGTFYTSEMTNGTPVSGLTPGSTNTFEVRAVDWQGVEYGTPLTLTQATSSGTTWAAGDGITATNITPISMKLTWPSALNASSYQVRINGDPIYYNTSYHSIDVAELTPDTKYYIEVVPLDGTGSAAGDELVLIVQTDPTWPEGSGITWSNVTATGAHLFWPQANDASYYNVYQDGVRILNGQLSNAITVEGLNPGATYTFMVKATDYYGHEFGEPLTVSITTAMGTTEPPGPVAPSLVLHYTFDDNTAMVDSSGNNNNGQFVNGTPTLATGKFGSSYRFYGSRAEVQSEELNAVGSPDVPYSISWWQSQTGSWGANLGQKYGYPDNYATTWNVWNKGGGALPEETGKLQVGIAATDEMAGTFLESPAPINDGMWHHVVLVKDTANDRVKLYLDNVLIQDVPYEGSTDNSNSAKLVLGSSFDGSHGWDTNGDARIDELRIYNGIALNADQVNILNSNGEVDLSADPGDPGTIWQEGGLTATGVTETGLQLSWPAANNAFFYNVYQGGNRIEGPASILSANVINLAPDTGYTFTVRATDQNGIEFGDPLTLTVRTLASAPAFDPDQNGDGKVDIYDVVLVAKNNPSKLPEMCQHYADAIEGYWQGQGSN